MSIPADTLPSRKAEPLDLLSGTRVLDLTTSVAGPAATQILGDLGATVIKIEKPGTGDDARAWGPPFLDGESLWFTSVNRNKRSVALDVASEPGRGILQRLVTRADVLVLNLVPRTQVKLRLDWPTLQSANTRLIHASITGFGLRGPRADLPCYDLIAEGYSGIMDLTGEPDSPPQKIGAPAADLLAGTDAALAIVAALHRRQRTGRGCQVDVSLVESMVRFVAPRTLPFLGSGEVPRRSGGRDSVIAIYQSFDSADLPLTLGLGNDAIWHRFWDAVGRPDYAMDPRFKTNADRRTHRAVIVEEIGRVLREKPRAQWLEIFERARIPAGPINRVDEVTNDLALRESGLFYAVDRDGIRIPQVGLGIKFDGRTEACELPPPKLGSSTAAVLQEWLELPADAIATLQTQQKQ
jgi:crotonobetainyl-CoA:carnitine CoA-transferase CaiB-like acyl-CoA transferase